MEINSSEQSKRQIEYLMHYLQPNGSREAPIYFAIQRIFQVGQHFHSSFSPKIGAQANGNAVQKKGGGVGVKAPVSGVKTKTHKDWWDTVDAHAHARASTNVPLTQARVKQAKAMLLQVEADLPTHIFDSVTRASNTAPIHADAGNKIWRLDQFHRVRQAWRAVVTKVASPGDLVNALLLLEVGILPPFSLLWESFVDTAPSTSTVSSMVSYEEANTRELMKDFIEAQMIQERSRKRHLAEQVALVKSTHRTCASVCMRLRSLQDRVRAGVTAQGDQTAR